MHMQTRSITSMSANVNKETGTPVQGQKSGKGKQGQVGGQATQPGIGQYLQSQITVSESESADSGIITDTVDPSLTDDSTPTEKELVKSLLTKIEAYVAD
eukprot:GHVU01002331.1.p1 GENE.GHVU01002331.1~~GHVU01002331.1.p1  ORF type:complete len:100 (-),score=4.81 GHVU01002331.1:352-651(-)